MAYQSTSATFKEFSKRSISLTEDSVVYKTIVDVPSWPPKLLSHGKLYLWAQKNIKLEIWLDFTDIVLLRLDNHSEYDTAELKLLVVQDESHYGDQYSSQFHLENGMNVVFTGLERMFLAEVDAKKVVSILFAIRLKTSGSFSDRSDSSEASCRTIGSSSSVFTNPLSLSVMRMFGDPECSDLIVQCRETEFPGMCRI